MSLTKSCALSGRRGTIYRLCLKLAEKFGLGVGRTLARGLSARDIEEAFQDETGRLLLSKTAVS